MQRRVRDMRSRLAEGIARATKPIAVEEQDKQETMSHNCNELRYVRV
jgi:hypothetical protein